MIHIDFTLPKEKRGYIVKDKDDYVIINGIVDKKSSYHFVESKTDNYVYFYDEAVFEEIYKAFVTEVNTIFQQVHLKEALEVDNMWIDINVNSNTEDKLMLEYPNEVLFEVDLDLETWNRPFTALEMIFNLQTVCAKKEDYAFFLTNDEKISEGFLIAFKFNDTEQTFGALINRCKEKFQEILSSVTLSLYNSIDKDILTTYFKFPEATKNASKQYLVYFAEFLRDLGIEAETEFVEDIRGTIFKVIPKNKKEALQNIKDALDVFIKASSAPVSIQISPSTDVGETKWNASIMHLQSQLMLAHTAIQMKDATIESLNLNNFRLKQMVDDKEKEVSSSETVIPNILTIDKIKFTGGSLNLAEIWRRMKQVLNKETK